MNACLRLLFLLFLFLFLPACATTSPTPVPSSPSALSVPSWEEIEREYAERQRELEQALARFPSSSSAKLALGKCLYYQAVEGLPTFDRALAIFEDLRVASPGDPDVIAYLGGVRLWQSNTTWAVWKKGKLASEGGALLDLAIELAPEDPEIRCLRGVVMSRLPEMFGRKGMARDDLSWVADRAEELVAGESLEPELAAAALFFLGEVLDPEVDAAVIRQNDERAVALAPRSRAGRKAWERSLQDPRP